MDNTNVLAHKYRKYTALSKRDPTNYVYRHKMLTYQKELSGLRTNSYSSKDMQFGGTDSKHWRRPNQNLSRTNSYPNVTNRQDGRMEGGDWRKTFGEIFQSDSERKKENDRLEKQRQQEILQRSTMGVPSSSMNNIKHAHTTTPSTSSMPKNQTSQPAMPGTNNVYAHPPMPPA